MWRNERSIVKSKIYSFSESVYTLYELAILQAQRFSFNPRRNFSGLKVPSDILFLGLRGP